MNCAKSNVYQERHGLSLFWLSFFFRQHISVDELLHEQHPLDKMVFDILARNAVKTV